MVVKKKKTWYLDFGSYGTHGGDRENAHNTARLKWLRLRNEKRNTVEQVVKGRGKGKLATKP